MTRSLIGGTGDKRTWPDLYLVGAAKGGTTSIHRGLDAHPNISMSTVKEPHCFSSYFDQESGGPKRFEPCLQRYQEIFPPEAEDLRGESSTSYLCHPRVAKRLKTVVPDAKILVSLRDPVDRAFSHYLMDRNKGMHIDRSFSEVVNRELEGQPVETDLFPGYLRTSQYTTHLQRYLRWFDFGQIHVLFFEEFVENPTETFRDIAEFIGVDKGGFSLEILDRAHNSFREPRYESLHELRHNPFIHNIARNVIPRRIRRSLMEAFDNAHLTSSDKPDLPRDLRDRLNQFFSDEIAELEGVLGRSVPEDWGGG